MRVCKCALRLSEYQEAFSLSNWIIAEIVEQKMLNEIGVALGELSLRFRYVVQLCSVSVFGEGLQVRIVVAQSSKRHSLLVIG